MKLRHQVLWLISIPLSCQFLSVALLVHGSVSMESAGLREGNAKKVMADCQELEGLLGLRLFQLVRASFLPATLKNRDCSGEINEILKDLKKLSAGNDRATPVVNGMTVSAGNFLSAMEDLSHSYVPGEDALFFSYIMYKSEFFETLANSFSRLKEQASDLNNIYGRIAEEFAPVAQKARGNLRTAIIGAIVANAALLGMFVFIINKQTLSRLQLLMNNIRSFSSGQSRVTLAGNDELTELDQTFSEVYAERLRLDDIRKSMTAMVSHDLRSPLTGMTILLDSMLEMEPENIPPKILQKLKKLRSATDRLNRLSHTLLDIEKIESGTVDVRLEPTNLSQVIEPSLALLAEVAQVKQIELKPLYDEAQFVVCDGDRTVQVLVNLLSNAIKFSPKGSTVQVCSRNTCSHRGKGQWNWCTR